jgi:hypothetical protein
MNSEEVTTDYAEEARIITYLSIRENPLQSASSAVNPYQKLELPLSGVRNGTAPRVGHPNNTGISMAQILTCAGIIHRGRNRKRRMLEHDG